MNLRPNTSSWFCHRNEWIQKSQQDMCRCCDRINGAHFARADCRRDSHVAAAVHTLEEGAHWDPAFQATVRSATTTRRVTLSEGQAATLMLDLMP